jgi:hypothetical protein
METSAKHPALLEDFQDAVDGALIRHRSVLDAMTKLQESQARLARAAAIAVTVCGCVSVSAGRQRIPPEAELAELHDYVSSHLQGMLCDRCREQVETELGQTLFYLTAVATLYGVSVSDVVAKDLARLRTLGVFNLT